MQLFFHHVGMAGSERDFPKTVFGSVSISTVEESFSVSDPRRSQLIQELWCQFPNGSMNAWGVPEGAWRVVQSLQVGDAVLLVDTPRAGGQVSALCQPLVFWREPLPTLSQALWGEEKFPYIFFFVTEPISLSWAEFISQVSYSPNYDPRGLFQSVSARHLDRFGGPEGYVQHLRTTHANPTLAMASLSARSIATLDDGNPLNIMDLQLQSSTFVQEAFTASPQLLNDDSEQLEQSARLRRNAAFQMLVKVLYNCRCAICGIQLRTPQGLPEVESAHIYPKRLRGRDDPRNGICLCRLHHWSFDCGWMSIDDDHHVVVHRDLPGDSDYDSIRRYAGAAIGLPANTLLAPHPLYLSQHRLLMGFSDQ